MGKGALACKFFVNHPNLYENLVMTKNNGRVNSGHNPNRSHTAKACYYKGFAE
jgi:hypothetical protein